MSKEHQQKIIVVAAIRNKKGDLLLAKRYEPRSKDRHGKWEFIGGNINFGEKPEHALIREVKEESGIKIKIIRLLPKIFSYYFLANNKKKLQVIILTYECVITSGKLRVDLKNNISELKFVPLSGVKNYNTFKNISQTLKLLS